MKTEKEGANNEMLERKLGRFVRKRQYKIEKVYRKPYNKLMKRDHFENNMS